MKKSRFTSLSILLVLIVFISAFFLLKDKNNDQEKEGNKVGVSGEKRDKTMTHENGDFVYTPSNEEIGYASEEGILFYENMLNVFLTSEISNEEADQLATLVNGDLVGKIQGSINMLQIQVEQRSLNELNELADQLMEEALVKYAGSSTPSFISDLNTDEEQEDPEIIDEVNPDGINWWAEAINAYSAWYYMDEHDRDFERVTVAVLEKGKLGKKKNEIDDESIDKNSVNVSGSSSKKAKYNTMGKSNLSHAELVTKIIAGDKNTQAIRGVAEPVVDIEFYSMGNKTRDEIREKIETSTEESVSEAEIISQIKSSIQADNVKVINNSWGFSPASETNWNENSWLQNLFKGESEKDEAYAKYLNAEKESNDEVTEQLIIALDDFLQSAKDNEFLIIQGAGNGYSRADDEDWDEDTTIDAKHSGMFANINDDTYKEASDLVKGNLENELADILNHIVIVGGAVQTEDKSGYKSPEWASYGEAIDIAAPAEDLFIGSFNGTSFAAPMVSGAAAMVWAYNPNMKASEVKNLLLNSAEYQVEDKRGNKTYSYPMLNMTAFLNEHPHNISVIETYMDEYPYYNELIETYRTAVSEQWEQSELDERNLGPSHYVPQPLSPDYGYEFRDINGNGLPELVLGEYREDGSAEIHEIYTLQNKKPVKLFVNGIRTNVDIYKDGTISESYSNRSMWYYKLDKKGVEKLEEGYDMNNVGKYERLIDPYELMTEGDIDAIHKKYNEIGIIDHSFTPFVLEEKETETSEVVGEGSELSNNEMEAIMRENYKKLEEILLEPDDIGELYDKYHEVEEAQKIWESGVDPNSPFYNEMDDLLYPKVKDLVAGEGMESFINVKYGMYWQPPATISFFGPEYDIEVLDADSERFKLKQTKEIPPHEKGGDYYDLIYIIDYVKEADKWKFAGAEKQE